MFIKRGGVVFLTHRSSGSDPESDNVAWSGYWEQMDPPGMLAEDEWKSAAAAIAWGRERCDKVLIGVDVPRRHYSAGAIQVDLEPLPTWPPIDADHFDP